MASRSPILSLLALALATLSAPKATPSARGPMVQLIPSIHGQVWFETASGQFGCMFTPEGGTPHYAPEDGGPEFKCERLRPDPVYVILREAGPAKVLPPDDYAGFALDSTVLPDGASTRWWQVTCRATAESLACSHDDGRGFLLGPRESRVW